MATIPGVRTILSDRFYTLSRTDAPGGLRVVAIGTRNKAYDADSVVPVQDFDPYEPRSERDVIEAFGQGSQLHRAYLEITAGGAAAVTLVALPEDTTDADLTDTTTGNVFDLAFDAAEIVQPDIIVPWGRGSGPEDWETPATPGNDLELGFVADNAAGVGTSLVKRVADKMKQITDRSNPVFAIMGVTPIPAATDNVTAAEMNTHLAFPNLTDHDATAFGENGSYVIVVATELKPVGYPTEFGYSNGAGLLAGQLSSLDSSAAVTGRGVVNVTGIRYTPPRGLQESMMDKGVIPVGLNYARSAVWTDGRTFGRSTSDYGRITTLRIVFEAMQRVRNKAQGFIGQPATLHMKNSLDTAISSTLRVMKENGTLNAATHVVSYVPRENRAIIDLVLTPVFELRNIDISISVNL